MKKITSIFAKADRDTVEVLRALLARAERGNLRGFAFAAKSLTGERHYVFTGEYWSDAEQGVAAASHLLYKLNQLVSARADDPVTESMPL